MGSTKLCKIMKKINNFLVLIFVFAGIMALNSCQDEEIHHSIVNNAVYETEILKFQSFDELDSIVLKTSQFSEDERINWENMMGFESFGTLSDRI